MSLETAALDHTIQVIRRQVEDDLRDLTLCFVLYQPGQIEKAVSGKRGELYDHPAGMDMYPFLKDLAKTADGQTMVAGLAIGEQKKFFPPGRRQKTLATLLINTAKFETLDDARQHGYHLVWHVLCLMENYKNRKTDFYMLEGAVIRPKLEPVAQARENMLADAFSGIMLEATKHKGAIRNLARKRSIMALQPLTHYDAEQFPYPIAADATQIVYDELMDISNPKLKLVTQARQITLEIGETYDDNAVRQWQAFAAAAQEMAWMNMDRNKILGIAVFTSEDPYVRSMAQLVAEALGVEPAPPGDMGANYNPFTDPEVNERHHSRASQENFNALTSKLPGTGKDDVFLEKAGRQNMRLMEGYPVGWCAHAILEARKAWKETGGESGDPVKAIEKPFQDARIRVPWLVLHTFSRRMIQGKRDGEEITAEWIKNFCAAHEGFELIRHAFEEAPPRQPDIPVVKDAKGKFTQFISTKNVSKTGTSET